MSTQEKLFTREQIAEWLDNIARLAKHADSSIDGERPKWADRTGDYQKDLGLIIDGANFLLNDYKKRMEVRKLQELFKD